MIKFSEKIKNSEIYITALEVIKTLSDAGFESYIVGGAVRDLLIKKNPKEYDICTSATPNEINKIFKKSKLVGQSFGVSIVLQDKYAFEIATFREDFDYLFKVLLSNLSSFSVIERQTLFFKNFLS